MVHSQANEVPRAELAITDPISNKREWNDCFIKFGSVLGNCSLILLDFNFTKRPEVNVAKNNKWEMTWT